MLEACLDALEGLAQSGDLTAEERVAVEEAVREAARLTREALIEAVRLSRTAPAGGYPEPHEVPLARRRAGELFERLKGLPATARLAVVQVAEEYQSWALCERVCRAAIRETSRDLEIAASWAGLAREVAVRVRGPEEWRSRNRGYAEAHVANVVRVQGDLKAADAGLGEAKRLWSAGIDPHGVLDMGRMLNLEASLRRDQRRFDEALALLDEAVAVGRFPERALVKKGFTLEVMGEYELALEALLAAEAGVERLRNVVDLNLANVLCHLSRHREAAELVPRIRILAGELGDRLDLVRLGWLEGRIAAGTGRPREARRLLTAARREFVQEGMMADAALALLEEAALLLAEGRAAEVRDLAVELAKILDSQGIEREALAALRLFREAVEQERATAELARRILRYLFRARHDQDLPFKL